MTKLSISLAAAVLSVTFAPTAGAYGVEPGPQSHADITPIAMSTPQSAAVEGACTVDVTPVLAQLLGLSGEWHDGDDAPNQTALACAQE